MNNRIEFSPWMQSTNEKAPQASRILNESFGRLWVWHAAPMKQKKKCSNLCASRHGTMCVGSPGIAGQLMIRAAFKSQWEVNANTVYPTTHEKKTCGRKLHQRTLVMIQTGHGLRGDLKKTLRTAHSACQMRLFYKVETWCHALTNTEKMKIVTDESGPW